MRTILELAKLVKRLGHIDGRKRLQKTVYILQQKGYPFDEVFEYGHYGPYSRALADELDTLVSDGLLIETERTGQYTEYSYEATDELARVLGGNDAIVGADGIEVDALLKVLGCQTTSVLEVASSRLFLRNSGYEGNELDRRLAGWKPSLVGCFDEAKGLLESLELPS